ncbi:hypothetical protein KQX54_008581 [Cotesia glomerata]|uniref:Uncharacterized protein n=1 Tax=Cotesia glomerata TaxID=32391 RepID=A0AAV7I287_COTGL|nr:hypothetical protein KQX54_008581 [Cotesia glomerata]
MKKSQLYSRSSQYRILKDSQERDDSSSDEEVDRINSNRGQPREINQNCRSTRSFNNTNCNRSDENENDESLSEKDADNVYDDNNDHGFEEAENIPNNRDINDEEMYETDSDDDSENSRESDGSSSFEESSTSENDTDSDDDMRNGSPNNNENLDSPLYENAPLSCGEKTIFHLRGIPMGYLYINRQSSVYGLFLIINELHFHLRSQLKNLFVADFWFGPKKPEANLFMNSFRHNLEIIYNGIFVSIPGHQNPVKIRGMIICGTCDLPAKAGFLNMKGHQGIYDCCKCKIKSEKLDLCENCEKNSSYFAIINECTVDKAVISNEHLDIGSIGRRSDKAMVAEEISKLELVCYYIEKDKENNSFYVMEPVNNREFF